MKKRLTLNQWDAVSGYLFLLPWLVGFFVFTFYPFFYSIYLSFQDVTLASGGIQTTFVGLRWYREAFTDDPTYIISLLDTVKFIAFSTPIIVVMAMILAVLLNNKFFGRLFFRAVFFFSVTIISGPVVNEMLFNNAAQIISPERFTIYRFAADLPSILAVPILYIFDNFVIIMWFSGVQIIIFLAGLQKIGKPLYEAASIDGASGWQVFWKIVLPFLKPVILLNSIYTVVMLSAFSGNEVNNEIVSKLTLTGKVYGYSSALSWIFFAVLAVMLGIVYLLFRKREKGGGQ